MSDLGLTAENVRLALLFLQASLRYRPNGLIPTRFLVAFCPVMGGAALAGEMAGKFRQQGGVQIGQRQLHGGAHALFVDEAHVKHL